MGLNGIKSVKFAEDNLAAKGIYMPLTTKDIEKFRALYLSQCGVNLSDDEAYTKASRLLRLFRAICSPDVSASNARKLQSEQTNHENVRDHE